VQFDSDAAPIESIGKTYVFIDPVWSTTVYSITKVEYSNRPPGNATSAAPKSVGGMGKGSIFIKYSPDVNTGSVEITKEPDFGYTDVSDDYSLVPDDVTFEFWYKNPPPPRIQNRYGMLFQQIGEYTVEPRAPGMGFDGNDLRVLCGTQWWYPGRSLPQTDPNWHQMDVTYDEQYNGEPNKMKVQFFMDGTLANSIVVADINDRLKARLGPELIHLMIGAENNRGWPYNATTGYFDEFAIYPRVLSAERVAIHYSMWAPRTCQEAIERGYSKLNADINHDCKVNFLDFAQFGVNWMLCDKPSTSGCSPNW
jgi:hypothetical protein